MYQTLIFIVIALAFALLKVYLEKRLAPLDAVGEERHQIKNLFIALDYEDILKTLRILEVKKTLAQTRIVLFGSPPTWHLRWYGFPDLEAIRRKTGLQFIPVELRELVDTVQKVDTEKAALNGVSIDTINKHLAMAMMKRKTGSIVNMASVVGIGGNPGQTNYSASKAGLIGFTKSLAKEVAARGVRVNAVAPGYIDTEMTQKLNDQAREAMLSQVPMGRPGTPEEVAKAVLFLASDLASYITGRVIQIDGGMAI